MRSRKNIVILAFVLLLCTATSAIATPSKYNLSGKVIGGAGYTVLFVQKNGLTKSVTLGASGTFAFRQLLLGQIRGASLQLVDPDGQYAGPVVLATKGSKVATTFAGKANTSSAFILGRIDLESDYAKVKKRLNKEVPARALVASTDGKPAGAGEYGLVETVSSGLVRIRADEPPSPGADGDLDGLPDTFDADDDGDLVLDASDPDSAGLDVPYTGMNFDFRRTINSHVRDGLTDDAIDDAVGGENAFSLTFFFSLPETTNIDGGHVVCADNLVYCRKDTPLAFYGGISESTDEFRNRPWSELLTSAGFPRMEKVELSRGSAIVASIQPRVGRSQFQPGDVYRVVLTNGTSQVSSRSLALTPYFVSIPAIKEYNAGSGAVTVDYASVDADSGSIPGTSEGDPIVLSSEGNLTVTFWRPQRQALRSDETGYYDWGNLNYGIVIDQLQATCGGLYSGVSSDLVEDETPLGEGDSPLASSGANLSPLRDSQGDRAVDITNTLTFTVNLKECLSRAGSSAGTYRVSLRAAGEDLTGGQNTAVQSISVQIP